MKGNAKVIDILNQRLAEELTAISQYMVHSEMCANWGFQKLHEAIEKQAIDEMKHAEMLIGRILFLEGTPTVSKLHKMIIGKTVEEIVTADENAEIDAVKAYNESIAAAVEGRRQRDGRDAEEDPAGRGAPRRLGRDAARADQADGPAELPGEPGVAPRVRSAAAGP